MQTNDSILWLDCIGGLVVGASVLAICQLLSQWEALPLAIVITMGIANLIYGLYSLFVTTRQHRPMYLVKILAAANMAWLFICAGIVFVWWNQITGIGLLHVIGEGAYVGVLGYTEWRMRESLSVL